MQNDIWVWQFSCFLPLYSHLTQVSLWHVQAEFVTSQLFFLVFTFPCGWLSIIKSPTLIIKVLHTHFFSYSNLSIKSVLGLKLGALTYRFGDQISNIYYLCIYFIYWLFCCFNVLILFTFNPFLLSFHAAYDLSTVEFTCIWHRAAFYVWQVLLNTSVLV